MLLLLVMYASPFLAVLLFWRTQRAALAGGAGLEAEAASPWSALRGALQTRAALVRPSAGAFLALAVVAGFAAGAAAALAVLAGVAMTAFVAAIGCVARTPAVSSMGAASAWNDSAAAAVAEAAVVAGGLGALAWFFADPAGAPVLAAFATGAASAALFADLVLGVSAPGSRPTFLAPLRGHLATFCAALMMAATAPAEELLPLGGLLAETETLRSELLLLPVALAVLSPLVAAASSPLVAMLVDRRGATGLDGAGRLATVLSAAAMGLVVALTGLSWNLLLAFAIGLAAREAAFALETVTSRASRLAGGPSPLLAPLAAAAAFCAAHEVAGGYGVAVAACAMTTAYVSSAACAATSRALQGDLAHDAAGRDCGDFSAALALLVATASAVVTQSARDGIAVEQVVVFAPSLLAGVVAGAAFGSAVASRFADADDEREAVAAASRAVLATALVPMVGLLAGPGGAVGTALGVLAGAATAPRGGSPDSRPVALAWATTMAMATLVATPLMVG